MRRLGRLPRVPGAITLLVVVTLTVVPAACSRGPAEEEPADTTSTPTEVYVAVGADATVGAGLRRSLVEAWPQELFAKLEPGATFVNAATEDATVTDAIDEQLPIAEELEPTLVTVWLNVNDLLAGVDPATYEDRLGELVAALRRDGTARVLIANTPPVETFATYKDDGDFLALPDATLVDAYNEAVATVADREGAEVVDLHAAVTDALAAGTFEDLLDDDRDEFDGDGHAWIAEAFEATLAG